MNPINHAIISQIYECHLEMKTAGLIKSATRSAPARQVTTAALPLAYAIARPLLTQIPLSDPSKVLVTRNYELQYPVASASTQSDDPNYGVLELEKASDFLDIVLDFWAARPRLQAANLPDGLRLAKDVLYTDGGVVEFPIAGGGPAWGVVATLTISAYIDNQSYQFS